ncbi:hypothetical protein IWW36_000235 [Coemansia brasiliensis]|uniref:Uncharacterized protein n=1 Tax=Coemansia brasiliensis TaxID=2650707 RepID=A0A9W8M2T7_9FUNG|nr:hypothetical protein IWW36_000235 [Coemansia brasiliensis]
MNTNYFTRKHSEEFELPISQTGGVSNSRRSGSSSRDWGRPSSDSDDGCALLVNSTAGAASYESLDIESHKAEKGGSGKQFTMGAVLVGRMRRVWQVLSERSRIGLWSLGLVLGKLAAEVVYYYAGIMPSEFYRVLGERDQGAFGPLLARCVGVVALAGMSKAGLEYASGMLGVAMRRELTRYTHSRYLQGGRLYAVVSGGRIDNPDQRIAQDVERLARSAAEVLTEVLIAPLLIGYYTVKCWMISGVFGPLAIYGYFVVGAIATRWAMAPIMRQVYRQEQAEGDFRFAQVRVREFAEAIAFYGGEATERKQADVALEQVVKAQQRVVGRQLGLGLVTQVFAYLGSTVSYVVIGIPIFMGIYDDKSGTELSSLISLSAFVSIYLVFRFSSVIEQSKRLADVGGYVTRIVQLWEELDVLDAEPQSEPDAGIAGQISAVDMTVATPTGKRLVVGLSLRVKQGQSLLITGPNGAGKTSLLRTLCGLWRPLQGTVQMRRDEVFFLPQTPYLPHGSLREQISYPGVWAGKHRKCSDAQAVQLLQLVGLEQAARRMGGSLDMQRSALEWQQRLSPGEQQRLAVARVLFWQPTFAALDESTSALDAAGEAAVYGALVAAGITLVSVSHHAGAAEFHQRRLALDGQGGCTLW